MIVNGQRNAGTERDRHRQTNEPLGVISFFFFLQPTGAPLVRLCFPCPLPVSVVLLQTAVKQIESDATSI